MNPTCRDRDGVEIDDDDEQNDCVAVQSTVDASGTT